MSTYLVAFANGDFEHLESSYTSPLSGKTCPLRIYGSSNLSSTSTTANYLISYSHRRAYQTRSVRPGCHSEGVQCWTRSSAIN
jgi:hypothetical protein